MESYYNSRDVDSWQINTQRGRFLLETLDKCASMEEVVDHFNKAHELLYNCPTKERYYPLRQVSLYKKVYEDYYSKFDKGDQVTFFFNCKQMIDALASEVEKMKSSDKTSQSRAKELARYKNDLETVIKKIVV